MQKSSKLIHSFLNFYLLDICMRWSEVKRPIVCLAPMDGVTNTAYRQIVRRLNPEVILFSEFTSVDGLVRSERVRTKLDYDPS